MPDGAAVNAVIAASSQAPARRRQCPALPRQARLRHHPIHTWRRLPGARNRPARYDLIDEG
ncbi:hypothetical protein ACH35V_22130 [Actinomadura sp. 1N219]|uniref:hypothetical protein n=1 Tax=Actinomadura sp. 1N219 TaxID=3375152 RepID=UPI0037A8E206